MSEMAETLSRALIECSVRIAFVALGVGAALAILRIRSASWRHTAWTAVLAAMLVMPFLMQIIPPVSIPWPGAPPRLATALIGGGELKAPSVVSSTQPPAANDSSDANDLRQSPAVSARAAAPGTERSPAPRRVWPTVILSIYLSGVILLSIRIVLGWRLMRRLAVGTRGLDLPGLADIRETALVSVPVTIGVLNPKVLLPSDWTSWPKEKLSAILNHENSHIRRRDPLVSFVSRINCALFWFHPLSWWLQRKLAITAEEACDDAVIEKICMPEQYAGFLLETAQSVGRTKGRFSWQAMAVSGHGSVSQRIDRILRRDALQVSRARRVAIAFSCGAVIFLGIACRNESVLLPENIELEEQQAVARRAAARDSSSGQLEKWVAQRRLVESGEKMTYQEADGLESRLLKNPESVQSREKLVYFYSRSLSSKEQGVREKAISGRRRHVLWFIEHQPDAEVLGTPSARIGPVGTNPDPEGYAKARQLWLSQTLQPVTALSVLENAALFLEVSDKALAEQLLLRAKALAPDNKWSIRLGRVYALSLLGVTEAFITSGMMTDLPSSGAIIGSMNVNEARDTFAQHARQALSESKDAQLLSAASAYLMMHPLGAAQGTQYLERAVQLDPDLIAARQRLLRIRSEGRYAETRAALRMIDKEKKYEAISALPEAERFVMLREMAEYSRGEAYSMEVLDPAGAKAARVRAKRYADELLKLAPKFRNDAGYSAAVFSAAVVAATVAAQDGETDTALEYLRTASRIPSSEEMAYSPPLGAMMALFQLSRILVDAGQRNELLALLGHLSVINKSWRDEILIMSANIRAGKPLP
jgi:hypothetical protein